MDEIAILALGSALPSLSHSGGFGVLYRNCAIGAGPRHFFDGPHHFQNSSKTRVFSGRQFVDGPRHFFDGPRHFRNSSKTVYFRTVTEKAHDVPQR